MSVRLIFLLLVLAAGPALAAAPPNQAAMAQAAAAHKAAALAARTQAKADATQAVLLAERQIAAAAALRRLENETGDAAATLSSLQAQAGAATAKLQASEAALGRLLPIMQRLASQPAAIMLAVPEPPDQATRGIVVMQGIAAAVEAQAAQVKQQSSAVVALLARSTAERDVLAAAVATQQQAEAALTAQVEAAKNAEMADAATGVAQAAAGIAADRRLHSLQAVVARLQALPAPDDVTPTRPTPGGTPNGLTGAAPVAGSVVQHYGDDTAAGPAVGVSYRAAPGARVVSPCAGPVLFAQNFQSYGLVVIVDCGGGYDFVLSGMTHLDVSGGQRLNRNQPVGEMLRFDAKDPTRMPVLYVELRRNGSPVDPAGWLGAGGSG